MILFYVHAGVKKLTIHQYGSCGRRADICLNIRRFGAM